MAISERLQQRINNLTNSMASPMGEINSPARPVSDKEMEMYMQANPDKPLFGSPSMGNIGGGKGAISDQERQMLIESLGMASNDFGPDATKPLDDLLISLGLGDLTDLNMMSGEQKLQMAQSAMDMAKQTKGAISNREMEMFRDATPSMGTIGGGMGAISDQERQMFMDSMPRQTDETQQAIDTLQQELQMTTDPEEAEGLGRMIQKLSLEMMAPMGGLAKQLAQAGGGEDTALAHVRPGEIVLPPEMMEDPRFEKMVEDKFKGLGIDPAQAVVGMGIASLNQSTGLEEFGFFKKIGKSLKKVVKKVAPLAVFVPGIGTALGGALGGLGGLATKGLAKVGLGGLGSALGSVGSTVMGGIANAGIPGLSSIAGGTASGFGGISGGLGSLKGLVGDGPLSGLLGGGQQAPSFDMKSSNLDPKTGMFVDGAGNSVDPSTYSKYLSDPKSIPMTGGGGNSIFGGGTPGQSRIGMIEDMLKNRPSDPVREGGGMFGGGGNQGGSMFGGGQGGGLGALGTAGLLGLAGSLGKMAYDETKNDSGVPLTPLNTMNAAGRFNMEAEIARRMGQQSPNPVEFGLLPQNTMPELSGGQAVPTGMMMGGEVMMPMQMAEGGALPNKGLEALNKVAPQVVDQMGYNMGGQVIPMGYNMGGRPMMPMQYAEGGNVAMEDFQRQNGMINGEGTETSDDVPAMLSDGEFVMTGQAVRGAGSYELQQGDGGILNLIPSLDEDRERGTELLYNMMEVFGNRANAS